MNEYIKRYKLSIDQIETYEWIKNQKIKVLVKNWGIRMS